MSEVFIFAVLLAAWTTVPDLDTEESISNFPNIYIHVEWIQTLLSGIVCLKLTSPLEPSAWQPPQDKFQCIEFFAGKAMLSKTQLWSGKRSVRLDIAYLKPTKGKNGKKHPMDITTPEGMSFLGLAFI